MNKSRQSKSTLALRLCAAVWLLAWIAASGFCALEPVFDQAESGAHHHADQTAAPSSEDSNHSHDSDKNDGAEHSCCTSLTAAPQFASSAIFTKPDFGKSLPLSFLWLAQTLTFVQPEAPAMRQSPDRQWVFTPEVCLGPAFRSHAPPRHLT
jgi:hypothetical protein